MVALVLMLLGWLAFIIGVVIEGVWLRRQLNKDAAESSSRVIHTLFFIGLGLPLVIAFFYPGYHHLDGLLGLPPLPYPTVFLVIGIMLVIPGLYLMAISNVTLRVLGKGANAFRLTKEMVENDIYQYTRNPMSLGYYLIGLGIAFISGSTLLTLYVLVGLIPAHLFTLKFFEELELQLRFGDAYQQYQKKVAFLFPRSPSI